MRHRPGTPPAAHRSGRADRVRRRAKVDANHGEIRDALKACGWTVVDMSRVGQGFPDFLCCKGGRIEMVEVKDGAKVKSAQKLTEDERAFADLMARAGVTVRIIKAVEQVVSL